MSGTASRTCSRLSSTRRSLFALKKASRPPSDAVAAPSVRPNVRATVDTTTAGVVATERSTNQTPSGKAPSDARDRATVVASLVFPTPPGPTIVTSRTSGWRSCSRRTSSSSPRPWSGEVSGGHNCGGPAATAESASRLGANERGGTAVIKADRCR
jgi:hypothetical protein